MSINTAHDIVPDSPTNVFATWNVLDTTATVSDGNLKVLTTNVYTFSTIFLPKSAGKFYVEYYVESMGYPQFGIYNHDTGTKTLYQSTNQTNESILIKNVNTADAFTHTSGDIISVLVDTTNETIQWFKNGGSTSSNISSSYTVDDFADNDYSFFTYHGSGAGTSTIRINHGQDSTFGGNVTSGSANATDANGLGDFYYAPPTDALALCTANLPDPAIDPNVDDLPEDYFKAVTYTGQQQADWDGTTGTVTVGFQPDLVWIKARETGYAQLFNDSLRGTGVELRGNETSTQIARTDGFTAFNSTGFSVGTNAAYNDSSKGMVAWNWKAGGAPSGATSATGSAKRINSSGTQDDTSCGALATAVSATITPTLMSINQKSGFSIIKYVGAGTTNSRTIPHGLSDTPDLIIIKDLDGSNDWIIWFQGFGADSYLRLNTSAAKSTVSNAWGGSPNSNTFSVYQSGAHNTSGRDYIAYCWHSVAGYSKFGSYIGNGSTDGPFVYCGFRPAFVICKVYNYSSSYASWAMFDNARDSSNVMNKVLYANKSKNEGYRGDASTAATNIHIDFLSNGFKPRSSQLEHNANGDGIIYMAFAEQPFKFSNAR